MNEIIESSKCCGCFACYNICPKKAIEMVKDEYGNVYPFIDKNKCVKCELCKKVCPQLRENLEFKTPITAYAMHINEAQKRKESTSGGAATAFYEEILKNDGVVYGASNLFGENEFKFVRIDNIKDLYKVKGSKYVHCFINETFIDVKKDLNNNKKVLFIGTPCQVAGLKSFLMKDYDNLITIDIVCHGVPSQQLLFDEIENLGINSKDVFYIFFRDDKGFNFTILDKKKQILVEKNCDLIDYYRNFLQGNFYRENCYNCRYAQKNRISDITIGDFWGVSRDSLAFDDEMKGISLIAPCTEKGKNLVDKISSGCTIDERTLDEACKENGQLNHPTGKNKKYNIFYDNYPKFGYKKTMKKMRTHKDNIKILVKENKILYKIIKKIKH